MRIKIAGHDIEGTPEEVAKLLSSLENLVPPVAKAVSVAAPPVGASPFVSEVLAHEVLTRRPLGVVHAKMLQVLDKAGDAWTPAPELQTVLGLSTRQFAGLLGAFGKRLSNTKGEGSRTFFDQYWDHENGYNLYRLPPSVRAALRTAKII